MVVNKCDLLGQEDQNDLQVTEEMINMAKKDLKMDKLFIVSAKTGEGVDDMFVEVAKLASKRGTARPCFLLWTVQLRAGQLDISILVVFLLYIWKLVIKSDSL